MKVVKLSFLALTLSLMSFTVVNNLEVSTEISTDSKGIVWKAETMDVGEIPQGTPKEIVFEFKNTGTSAVIITNVKPSCGCTAADYTKEPIAPGKVGYVKAIYNAAAAGAFMKNITVTTNAEETPKSLSFKGIVVVKS
jgi:uncharacterized protein YbbK (DUF523 family)